MKIKSVWIDTYRSVVDNGRGHSVIVDLPPDQNGVNTGATTLELAAMSLAGCVTTIFKVVAVKRKFEFKALKVELEADKPKEADTITNVTGNVEIVTDADEAEARTVFNLTMGSCPVGALFVRAGLRPDWVVTVKHQ
jgi:putative redox protein